MYLSMILTHLYEEYTLDIPYVFIFLKKIIIFNIKWSFAVFASS